MSQEIYNDLGQLGSLVMLGTMVAAVDGSFEESEFESIVDGFLKFAKEDSATPEHFAKIMDKVQNAHKTLETFENKVNYAAAVLNSFKSKFDADTRKAILALYNDIAMADLEMHPNEAALLGLYTRHLL
jgi:uncharacterized tellurite resistance protein B-like protein